MGQQHIMQPQPMSRKDGISLSTDQQPLTLVAHKMAILIQFQTTETTSTTCTAIGKFSWAPVFLGHDHHPRRT
jgi:hypothetical protein